MAFLARATRALVARSSSSALRAPVFAAAARHASFWSNVPMGPKDPILGVAENFKVRLFRLVCAVM